jgi:hypothetical protein
MDVNVVKVLSDPIRFHPYICAPENLKEKSHRSCYRTSDFFCFLAPLAKDSHKYTPFGKISKKDPELGAMDRGAEV